MSEDYSDSRIVPSPISSPGGKPLQVLTKGEYPDVLQQSLSPITEDTSWAFTYQPRGVEI